MKCGSYPIFFRSYRLVSALRQKSRINEQKYNYDRVKLCSYPLVINCSIHKNYWCTQQYSFQTRPRSFFRLLSTDGPWHLPRFQQRNSSRYCVYPLILTLLRFIPTNKRNAHRHFFIDIPKKILTTQQTIARPPKNIAYVQFLKQKCTYNPLSFRPWYRVADSCQQFIFSTNRWNFRIYSI
jgi:hypothetical protein